ncbi:hypothetical protein, partial [Pseudomonas viridiflava]
ACTSDEYSSAELQHSRTNGTPPGPLPQNPVSSVGCRLFDKRWLAGDGVRSVTDRSLQKKHRRQAASHSPWSQQDSGITLSTSMGMIGVLEIMLIVPTLRAHRYTQVRKTRKTGGKTKVTD